jgi:hypothetical protein
MEARMSAGDQVNLELFGRLTDRLGRTLQRVGLKRVPRDIGPSLADIIAQDEAEEAARAAQSLTEDTEETE